MITPDVESTKINVNRSGMKSWHNKVMFIFYYTIRTSSVSEPSYVWGPTSDIVWVLQLLKVAKKIFDVWLAISI